MFPRNLQEKFYQIKRSNTCLKIREFLFRIRSHARAENVLKRCQKMRINFSADGMTGHFWKIVQNFMPELVGTFCFCKYGQNPSGGG